ncbi:inositol monophosphatase family protein [Desulfobaculum sp. SPO524]|uniref:inositol monophosphatase family protein n=1 Tax=Desulfobaculum sp. SPO524 TaxID=3378071 RepID=UPI003851F913
MSDYVTPLLLTRTLAAVREAGRIVTDAWNTPRNITYKGRIDLVTETDVAVENLLKERLGEILPEAGMLAEESAESLEPQALTWIVDPVDGTTNFAHGIPLCAISVALWRDGRPELGIVSLPVMDELFYAVRGQGATLNGAPINVTTEADPERALVATGFPYTVKEDLPRIIAPLERVLATCQGVRRMGAAAVDLAYVACGRMDAFYERGLKPWDTAAGMLLVEEAGGRVSAFDAGTPYTFGGGILASNGPLHEAMSSLITE